jgi:transposase
MQTRARILLKAHAELTSRDIGEALDVSAERIDQVRQRFVEEGLEVALNERPRPGQRPKLTDRQCARVIAIVCSAAPEDHDHCTLRLLADKIVELGCASSFRHEGVRALLKKLPQAVAKRAMVHSGRERRFRGGDGGCAGLDRGAVRRAAAGGV